MRLSCVLLIALAGATVGRALVARPGQQSKTNPSLPGYPGSDDTIMALHFRAPITQLPKCAPRRWLSDEPVDMHVCYDTGTASADWTVWNLFPSANPAINPAWVHIRNGLVVRLEYNLDPSEAEKYKNAFTAKYGPPFSTTDQALQNGSGATTTNHIVLWRTPTMRAVLLSQGRKIGLGFFTVMTSEEADEIKRATSRDEHSLDGKF